MADQPTIPTPEAVTTTPEDVPVDSPPLTTLHLFLWTACIAIATTLLVWLFPREPGNEMRWAGMLLYGIAVQGTALFVAAIWLVRRFYYGLEFPTQPGHWFALAFFCAMLANVALLAGRPSWFAAFVARVGFDCMLLILVFASGVIALLGTRFTDGLLWRICLALYALVQALTGTSIVGEYLMPIPNAFASAEAFHRWVLPWQIAYWLGLMLNLLACAVAMAAVTADFRLQTRRDWLHYVGFGLIMFLLADAVWQLVQVSAGSSG